MPYIYKGTRANFRLAPRQTPKTAGELNFLIHLAIEAYLKDKPVDYTLLSSVSGVLSDVTQEYYRRKMAPYELSKIRENGDIELYNHL